MGNNHFFLIAIGAILVALGFLAEFLAHKLTQDKENRVRAELERWRKSAAEDSKDPVFLPIFEIPARLLARLFGPRPLSLRALGISALITTLLLVVCFSLAVVFDGFNPPERLFSESLDLMRKHSADFAKVGDVSQFQRNLSDISQLRGPVYGVLYTAYFFVATFAVTSLFSFLALAFCRRLLQTAVQIKDLFSLCVVLTADVVGAIFLFALQCSVLSILLFPFFWPSVPLVLQTFRQAPVLGLVLTVIWGLLAPLFYWFTSASWLRIALVLSLSPCLLIAAIVLLNLLTRLFKSTCSGYVVSLLDIALASRRGVFQFFRFCCAVAIPLCSFVVWLAQLKLTPLLVGSLFLLSLVVAARTNRVQGGLLRAPYLRATCLFGGGHVMVSIGYYLQAIIDCFRDPSSAVYPLSAPLLCSLVPGGMAGLWFVYTRLENRRFWSLTLGYFAVLTLVDFCRSLLGELPYAEFVASVPLNIAGAPLAGLAIKFADRFLFPMNEEALRPHVANEPAPVPTP